MVTASGSGGTGLGKVQRTAPLRTNLAATVADAISLLCSPVTPDEAAQGFRSDLSTLTFDAELQGRSVALDVTNVEVLTEDGTLLGQIVLYLAGLDGVESVDVVRRDPSEVFNVYRRSATETCSKRARR